jgi:hypothetical protein
MMCHPPSNTACRGRCTRRHLGARTGQRPCAVLANADTLEPPTTLDAQHAALARAAAASSAMRPLLRRTRQSAGWSTSRLWMSQPFVLPSSAKAVQGASSASRGSRLPTRPLPPRPSTLVRQPPLPMCAHTCGRIRGVERRQGARVLADRERREDAEELIRRGCGVVCAGRSGTEKSISSIMR